MADLSQQRCQGLVGNDALGRLVETRWITMTRTSRLAAMLELNARLVGRVAAIKGNDEFDML
jgi:hypothetical protein